MAQRRVTDEPAFVLHRYDWSEASLVLEVFSRHHGRMALVAKGVKRPTSQFRPVLLPLQPLLLAWGGDAEVRTLKSAQWQGGHVMPIGDALLAGSYLNELLLRLLARDDPHPRLFDHYRRAVQLLASGQGTAPWVLRAFELVLLRETGLLPDLATRAALCCRCRPIATTPWTPKTVCVWPEPTRPTLCLVNKLCSCKALSTPASPTPDCGLRARPVRRPCVNLCARCCTTIAGCRCSKPAN